MGRAESIFQERALKNKLILRLRIRPFTRRMKKREQELIDRKDRAQTAYLKSDAKAGRDYYRYEKAQKALDQYRARKANQSKGLGPGSGRTGRRDKNTRSALRAEDSDARKTRQR
jgi:hypothetical protein